jgi:uncharacterized protein YcbX
MIISIYFRWKKVGEISDLWCFPIKSCGPISMKEIECRKLGPESGYLRDRVFMIVRKSADKSNCHECVTARTYPKMVLISPKIEGSFMTVSAPGMKELKIDIGKLYDSKNKIKTTIWSNEAECVDIGDEAARWFSKFILGENDGMRFVFYPSENPKPEIKDKKYLFEQADQKDTGALHDETSFMMMNQGSFDDLNTKIDFTVSPLQYRPNFVVKGPAAWEEDKWNWIKIGDKTIFKAVQPCIRCVLTNIDPVKGERHPEMEPLKTLKTFRSFEKIAKNGPYFGIHLGLRGKEGNVKVGDEVYVA